MATSLPRNSRISSCDILTTSRCLIPSPKRIFPPTTFPGSGTRRRIESAVTDLPLPDSPTMPRVSPLLTSKLIPSTALTVPEEVKKCVFRSSTWRSGASVLPPHAWVEGVAQTVAEGVQRDQRQRERERGDQRHVRRDLQRLVAFGRHRAPGRGGGRDAEPEVAQEGLENDRLRDQEGGLHDDRPERVGQDVPDQESHVPGPDGASGLHELALAEAQRLASDQPRHVHPVGQGDG